MSPVTIIELVCAAVLLALCAMTAWLVLRRASRARIREWPAAVLPVALIAAALPWVYLFTHGGHFTVDAHTIPQLAGAIIMVFLAIADYVLFPLAVVLATVVWLLARRTTSPAP